MEENKNIEETVAAEVTEEVAATEETPATEATEQTVSEEVTAEETAAEEVAEEKTEEAPKKSGVMSDFVNTYIPSDEELAKRKKIAEVWDKITTGLLIALMASPFLIIGYIVYFFLTR